MVIRRPNNESWSLSAEEVTLVKNQLCKGASDEELKYCLTVARRHKLDPFKRQIWFVRRWDSNADNGKGGTGAHIWTPTVGIDGLLMTASRDHYKDFGSISKPVYGPDVQVSNGNGSNKMVAPAWAAVKVYKKGIAEPTEGEVRWSEYAPADMSKAPFWRKMPYRMLSKCATALALREAYPDLGGLYIPEELDRSSQDYTPEGRQIVDESGFSPSGDAVTHEAHRQVGKEKQNQIAERVTQEKKEQIDETQRLRDHKLWCDKHRGPISKCPSDEHSPAELEDMDNAERKYKEFLKLKDSSSKSETEKPPIDVKPATKEAPKQEKPKEEPAPKVEPFGTITLDMTTEPYRLTGDLYTEQKAMDRLTPHLNTLHRKDDFWVIDAPDVHVIISFGRQCNFKIELLENKENPPAKKREKEVAGTVKGRVTKVSDIHETEKGGKFVVVTIDKTKYTCWSKSSVPYIAEHALNKTCEFNIDKRHAIIGIVKIGDTTFRDNEPSGPLT